MNTWFSELVDQKYGFVVIWRSAGGMNVNIRTVKEFKVSDMSQSKLDTISARAGAGWTVGFYSRTEKEELEASAV